MANQRGQGLSITPVDWSAAEGSDRGLPSSTAGAADRTTETGSAMFGALGAKVGALADQLAASEGKKAGLAAGTDPNFRPTGGATIRDQAFDKAATDTYLSNLDAGLSSDMTNAYLQWKAKPAAAPSELLSQFEAIKAGYLKDHVFPEVAGDFTKRYSHLSLGFMTQAATSWDDYVKSQKQAALLADLAARDNARAALLAGDPNQPGTAAALDEEAKRTEGRIRQAVGDGAIDPKTAETMVLRQRDDDNVSRWKAAIEKMPTDQLGAARQDFNKRLAAGELVHLSDRARQMIDGAFEGEIAARAREGVSDAHQFQKQGDDLVDRALAGNPPPAGEVTDYLARAGGSPWAGAAAPQTVRRLGWVEFGRAMGPAGLAAVERKLIAEGGPTPTAETAADIEWLRKARQKFEEQQKTNPVGFVQSQRLAPIGDLPIDGSADDLAAALRSRVSQMTGARAVDAGIADRYLAPEEVQRLRARVAKGGDEALAVAAAIARGAGPQAPQLLRQVGGDTVEFARLGAMVAGGLPPQIETARDLADYLALKARKGDEKAKDFFTPLPEDAAATRKEVFGKTFIDHAGAEQDIVLAAEGIYKMSAYRKQLTDPKSDDAKALWKAALQKAAGAYEVDGATYGGFAPYKGDSWWFGGTTVRVPDTVRPTLFPRVVGAVTDADLKDLAKPPKTPDGRAFTAADIRNSYPVAVPGGYRFSATDPTADGSRPRWITTEDGRPWVMDWATFEPKLRQRVPAAFLGATGGTAPGPQEPKTLR